MGILLCLLHDCGNELELGAAFQKAESEMVRQGFGGTVAVDNFGQRQEWVREKGERYGLRVRRRILVDDHGGIFLLQHQLVADPKLNGILTLTRPLMERNRLGVKVSYQDAETKTCVECGTSLRIDFTYSIEKPNVKLVGVELFGARPDLFTLEHQAPAPPCVVFKSDSPGSFGGAVIRFKFDIFGRQFVIGRTIATEAGNPELIKQLAISKPYIRLRKVINMPDHCDFFEGNRTAINVRATKSYKLVNSEVLHSTLTKFNYQDYFHSLLFIEEEQALENLKSACVFGVTFSKFHKPGPSNCWYATIDDSHLEGSVLSPEMFRPSVDLLAIVAGQDRGYCGTIHRYSAKKLYINFVGTFDGSHGPVDLKFQLDRASFQRYHRIIDLFPEVPQKVLFPSESDIQNHLLPEAMSPLVNQLNIAQRSALRHILSNVGQISSPPYLVWGGPGTGKTTTLVCTILAALKARKQTRIIVGTVTNAAADLIVQRLAQHLSCNEFSEFKMFRSLAKRRRIEDVSQYALPFAAYDQENELFLPSPPNDPHFASCNIVVTTLSNASSLYQTGVRRDAFDLVLLDECSQASEPASLCLIGPFVSEKTTLAMFGDHKQLGPYVESKRAQEALSLSLFGRLMECPIYRANGQGEHDPRLCTMLNEAHRCHPAILKVSNDLYYAGKLKPTESEASTSLAHSPLLIKDGVPLIFDQVQGVHQREGGSESTFNAHEAQRVFEWTQKLLQSGIPGNEIGIITPYNKQKEKLKSIFARYDLDAQIDIGSVESFQGQERKVIVVSTVRGFPQNDFMGTQTDVGDFVGDERRFNVALTRAKSLLIVVGNPQVLAKSPCWLAFINHCKDQGVCCGMPPPQPLQKTNLTELFNQLTIDFKYQISAAGPANQGYHNGTTSDHYMARFSEDLPSRINSALSSPRPMKRFKSTTG